MGRGKQILHEHSRERGAVGRKSRKLIEIRLGIDIMTDPGRDMKEKKEVNRGIQTNRKGRTEFEPDLLANQGASSNGRRRKRRRR
jgi:hypothetical protein